MKFQELRFHKKLHQAKSMDEFRQTLGDEFVRCGFERAIVCRLSSDMRALVVVTLSGKGPFPRIRRRLAISNAPQLDQTLKMGQTFMSPPGDPARNRLHAYHSELHGQNDMWWFDVPVIHDTQPIGMVAADCSCKSVNTPDSVVELSERIVDALVDHYASVRSRLESERVIQAYERLIKIDEHLCVMLLQAFEAKRPDLRPLFQSLTDSVISVTRATCCDISLKTGNIFAPIAQSGELDSIGQSASISDNIGQHSVSLECIRQGTPQKIIGKRRDPMYKAMQASLTNPKQKALLSRLRAWGAFPVAVGDEVQGALSVASSNWDFFSRWREFVLTLFSQKASLALTVQHLVTYTSEQLKTKENAIKELSFQLARASSTVSYSEAARTVVHSIGNLLQPVGSNLEKVQKWSSHQRGKFPQQALDRVMATLGDVEEEFDYYYDLKQQTSELKVVDVQEILAAIIDFCELRADKYGIEIVLRRAYGKIRARCPSAELSQAFINLIVNSIEAFTDPSCKSRKGRRILIRVATSPENILINFEDNGIGIRSQHLKRVFDSGFTTKKERGGTGLGLPHVKNVISGLCGGTVEIASNYNKGTTVYVTLPLVKGGS